jgi:hypothetical protein
MGRTGGRTYDGCREAVVPGSLTPPPESKEWGEREVTCGSDFVCSRGFLSETKSDPPCDRARRRRIGRPETGGSSVLSGLRALFSVWVIFLRVTQNCDYETVKNSYESIPRKSGSVRQS